VGKRAVKGNKNVSWECPNKILEETRDILIWSRLQRGNKTSKIMDRARIWEWYSIVFHGNSFSFYCSPSLLPKNHSKTDLLIK
jgi:hypothetical protein